MPLDAGCTYTLGIFVVGARRIPAKVGRHVIIVAARDGARHRAASGQLWGLLDRAADVAVGEGRGFEASVVEEQMGFGFWGRTRGV